MSARKFFLSDYLYDAYRRTAFLYFIFSVQLKTFNLCNNSLLPLVEQQLLVVGEIFLAAVTTDKTRSIVADGQFRDEDQQLLSFAKHLLAESKGIGKLFPRTIRQLFECLGAVIKCLF